MPLSRHSYAYTDSPDPEPDPDPYFDIVEFWCHHGELAKAAVNLRPFDTYRKSTLGLDDAGAAELRRHLAAHHLVMVDEDTHWTFLDARLNPPCANPACDKLAAEGREICGATACLAALGRDELARRRGPRR